MRLEIVLEADVNAHSFRPRDRARGELLIWGHTFKKPPRITATLRGKLNVYSKRQTGGNSAYTGSACNGSDHVVYTLLEESKQIELTTKGSTLSSPNSRYSHEADYYAPFDFTFPGSNSCCPCQLPPSLEMTSSGLTIKVEYVIIVAVRHQVLC
ncbi:hypothetical protein B0J13DRAFT_209052 [Dactylonectria estremocensis]|uniref:Arrestin-like N-terminal domain-containing protein n=1 Tax=Dactylonectria estremocensis TaxID=1079267 RepID=A0A9P9DA29_9HYPO|nr:hypothetical protein B0J13DRAFT_209052 [Dactylonectria estremocensis]